MNENRQIPREFKKFFWDADFTKLNIPEHGNYVLGKLMAYGDIDSIKWILSTFDRGTIKSYLEKRGERTLDKKSYLFWTKILRMEDLWHRKQPANSIKGECMPTISMFYGILIRMFFKDIEKHHVPHIHADYQGQVSTYSIPDGDLLAGDLPQNKHKLVVAWIEIHKEELMADWELAVNGKKPFVIKGLDQ